MQIEIKNLGPIASAKIDLNKKLNVFCGPNNSGKTYLAFIIYALTKSELKFHKTNMPTYVWQELLKEQTVTFEPNYDHIWQYRMSEINNIKQSLGSIFGISEEVKEKLFSTFSIQITESKAAFLEKNQLRNIQFSLALKDLAIQISKPSDTTKITISLENTIVTKENIEVLELFLQSQLYSLIAFYPFSNSYILPVERNSIYTFSKELSIKRQEFFDSAQDLGSNKNNSPFHWFMKRLTRYPMPIRDGLEIAEDLVNYSKTKSEFYEFAEEIETQLLQGKISLSKDGEVLFSSEKAKTKKIPIHLSASIVKTLSSLIFYLKYIASKNDLIIIDEPELNLHPNNQVILTRIFAKLIQKDFRLLISTHSDYIIRELNNLIMVAADKDGIDELRTKYGYAEDERIDAAQIGAYLFNYKNKRSRKIHVAPIEITATGFEVSTIDETIDSINEITEQLFYTIKYGKEEEENE